MKRILFVDDEPDIRAVFSDGLFLAGYTVDAAASAQEALDLASHASYDIAIVDFILPGMRGLELVHKLKQQNSFLRTIIISGQIDHGVIDAREVQKELSERIAADRYLAKPVSVQSVVDAIEELTKKGSDGQLEWQAIAKEVVASRKVRATDVKEMDQKLRKSRKKAR